MKTSQVITLAIAPDAYDEGTEGFSVVLSTPTNATLAKSQAFVTVTPPIAWVTSTTAEFRSGTLTGTAVAENANGELTLSPADGAEFSDSKLPAGWTSSVLTVGGQATVADGIVTVDGLSLGSGMTYGAGRTLEFAAKFATTVYRTSGSACRPR